MRLSLSREHASFVLFGIIVLAAIFLRIDGVQPRNSPDPVVSSPEAVVLTTSTIRTVLVPWPTSVSSTAMIVRVIDGDTVEARLDTEARLVKIRLLGINTPESVDPRRPVQCFGKEASTFLRALVEGKRVALLEDPQADDRDKYGRLLRNLVMEEGTDVNATLVANGYAQAYLSFPLMKVRKTQITVLQEEAKAASRGLWNPTTCNGEAYP